jgi:hypothetical protein
VRKYGKTRAEVNEKLTKEKQQAQQGILRPDRSWIVADYLDYWLNEVVRVTKPPTTYCRYEVAVDAIEEPKWWWFSFGWYAIVWVAVKLLFVASLKLPAKLESIRVVGGEDAANGSRCWLVRSRIAC